MAAHVEGQAKESFATMATVSVASVIMHRPVSPSVTVPEDA